MEPRFKVAQMQQRGKSVEISAPDVIPAEAMAEGR